MTTTVAGSQAAFRAIRIQNNLKYFSLQNIFKQKI